jgi:hypothetical protein
MRPNTIAILAGILLTIVAFVAWKSSDERPDAPGSHRNNSNTKR